MVIPPCSSAVHAGKVQAEHKGLFRKEVWLSTAADVDKTISQVQRIESRLSGAERGWLAGSLRRALQAITLAPHGADSELR